MSADVPASEPMVLPEVGPGFGCLVIAFLYVLVLGAGGLLYAFTKSQSHGGVLTMAVLLGFVLFHEVPNLTTMLGAAIVIR